MSELESSFEPRLDLRLPIAEVRLWSRAGDRRLPDGLLAGLPADDTLVALGDDRFLVLPRAGDPALYDTAVFWCQRLLADPADRANRLPLAALVLPGEAILDGGAPRPVDSQLAADLDRQPPELEAGKVYITTWAAKMLEATHPLTGGLSYRGPSGNSAPLLEVGPPGPELVPWRNPEILNRRLKLVQRARLADPLSAVLGGVGARLEGPPGCGKSRLLAACLAERGAKRLWLRAQPARRGGPNLVAQTARHLIAPTAAQQQDPLYPALGAAERGRLRQGLQTARAEGPSGLARWLAGALGETSAGAPLYLVVDDAEQLEPDDLALVAGLLDRAAATAALRPLLVGRGRQWPAALSELPRLAVPPFSADEMEQFADGLLTGLSLPAPVRQRLLTATVGFPFALEEGVFELVRSKEVRRVYGSFFFGGDDSASYRPSLRLVCHLEAEAARLGGSAPLRLAALAETAAPPEELAAAAEIFSHRPAAGWDEAVVASGLAASRESPWGPALEPACPAFGAALARSVDPEQAAAARGIIGELLAARRSTGEASWGAYRLVAGSGEGAAALLAAAQSSFAKTLPREELLDSLTAELRAHRRRSGDAATGLRLIWQLLPLARRLGRLHDYEEELTWAVEVAQSEPQRMLALASVKAEMEQEAGRYQEAEATIQQALKAAKGIDLRRQAMLLIQLGKLFSRRGRYAEARQLFHNLLQTLEQQGLAPLAASCRFHLGNIAMHERRLEDAARHHRAALEERQRQKLAAPAGLSLSALGAVSLAQGNYPQALDYYRRAHESLTQHGKPTDISYTLMGLGRALTLLGDFTAASKPLRQALELRTGRDDVAGESIARLEVARNHLHLGRPEAALKEARAAHFHLQLLSVAAPTADAETLLGRIRLAQRRYEEARTHLGEGLAAHRKLGLELAAAFDLAWLMDTALATDNVEGVRRYAIDLKALLDRLERPDLGERLELRMYRGLDYLATKGHKVVGASVHLEAAYREVLRKAAHLDPEVRHRFLLQIADNKAIVDAAARAGLAAEP